MIPSPLGAPHVWVMYVLFTLGRPCLLSGIVLYAAGSIVGRRGDRATGFYRIVLQRVGVGLVMEGLLLSILARLTLSAGALPIGWTLLFGPLMVVGVPALVLWQIRQPPPAAAGVKARQARTTAGWLLVGVTSVLVIGFLGTCGYTAGAILWPHTEFHYSPVGELVGSLLGGLLGLGLVQRGLREQS